MALDLGVRYPRVTAAGLDPLLAAVAEAMPAWRDAGPTVRAAVSLEILARLHERVFELANAVQHTSGQAFVMAFQAGGTHALDRGLEAVAYAYEEQTRTPATAHWEKPAGKGEPLRMTKTFHVVPRGVALVIGCNTFPTWNSWPGLFASLATGNAVVVKPHPNAVLPLCDHCADCARRTRRERFRSQSRDAGRGGPGGPVGGSARGPPRSEDHRLHRLERIRDVARAERPPSRRVHGEVRRQHSGRRLDRRFRRTVPQPGVLVQPLHRPDVHGAAERVRAARGNRHRRGAQVLRRGRRGRCRGRAEVAG